MTSIQRILTELGTRFIKIRLNLCTTGINSVYDQVKRKHLHSSYWKTSLVKFFSTCVSDPVHSYIASPLISHLLNKNFHPKTNPPQNQNVNTMSTTPSQALPLSKQSSMDNQLSQTPPTARNKPSNNPPSVRPRTVRFKPEFISRRKKYNISSTKSLTTSAPALIARTPKDKANIAAMNGVGTPVPISNDTNKTIGDLIWILIQLASFRSHTFVHCIYRKINVSSPFNPSPCANFPNMHHDVTHRYQGSLILGILELNIVRIQLSHHLHVTKLSLVHSHFYSSLRLMFFLSHSELHSSLQSSSYLFILPGATQPFLTQHSADSNLLFILVPTLFYSVFSVVHSLNYLLSHDLVLSYVGSYFHLFSVVFISNSLCFLFRPDSFLVLKN
ncbi:hypothetical protein VP01_5055g1 [Puccinia sorghi]|uniref:Uncharacterized protein n=1 Tax=Puccinia sorghi TaxID=27349 RepID=A0A0L6UNJ6_9BASI|nr:hypothetical protein VP01_5055g1 [Puccinia sorghi]